MKSAQCQLNTEYYLTKLIELGISENILTDVGLHLEHIYKILRFSLSRKHFDVMVNQAWQVQALSGDLAYYHGFENANLFKDNLGAGIAHYAAWSGNPDALAFVLGKYPDCLDITLSYFERMQLSDLQSAMLKNNCRSFLEAKEVIPYLLMRTTYGRTIAHYAAISDSSDMMDYIANNHSHYLDNGDYIDNSNPAYYAVSSKAFNTLNWFKANYPNLLGKREINSRTIAHYAVYHGLCDVLDWVIDNLPKLLDEGDWYNLTIDQSAAKSGNSDMLNRVLSLSKHPETLTLQLRKSNMDLMLSTLLKALETNITLISVRFQGRRQPGDEMLRKINCMLERNHQIMHYKACVKVFMYMFRLNTSTHAGNDIALHILGYMLPSFVDTVKQHQEIVLQLEPKHRAIYIVKKEIARLTPRQETQNTVLGISMDFVIPNSDKKLMVLYTLIQLIQCNEDDILLQIEQLENLYAPVLEERPNKIQGWFHNVDSFFSPQSVPVNETMQCILKVKKLLSTELDTQPVLKMNAQS